jgi:hypothetical protein
LVGLGFVPFRPITRSVADHSGKQEAVANGWAAVRVNPPLKRKPDEGCCIAFRPFPISGDGNAQLDERLRQDHSQVVIGNQPVNQRDSVESC